jgi:hypothetical protein
MHLSHNSFTNNTSGRTIQFGNYDIERIRFGTYDAMTFVTGQDLSNRHFFISLLGQGHPGYDWVKTYRNTQFLLQGTAFSYGASTNHTDFGDNLTLTGAVESTNPFMSGYMNFKFDQQTGTITETNRYDLWLWGYGSISDYLTTWGNTNSSMHGVAERRNANFDDNKFYLWNGNVAACKAPLTFDNTNEPFSVSENRNITVQSVTGAYANIVQVTSPDEINASIINTCFDHGRIGTIDNEKNPPTIPAHSLPRYIPFPLPERTLPRKSHPHINPETEITAAPRITLSPNPAATELNLQSDSPIQALRITEMSGKIIKTYYIKDNFNFSISISHLKTGSYMVQIHHTNGRITTRKFIVQ